MHYSTRLVHNNPTSSINDARYAEILAVFQHLYLDRNMAESSTVQAMVANCCVEYQLRCFAIVPLVAQGLVLFVPTPLVFSVRLSFCMKIFETINSPQQFHKILQTKIIIIDKNLKFFC